MKKKMLSAALLLAALLCLCAAATAQTGSNTSTTAANAWINSDIRKFLNNTAASNVANSTEVYNSTNDSGYAAHFTDAEYALMQPTTVNTLTKVGDSTQNVTTTDRIFLPSGVSSYNMKVLSWGQEDLVGMNVSDVSDKKTVLIPLGYWAADDSGRLWLRSAGTESDKAMSYRRTESVDQSQNVSTALGVAPVFTLNAENILFASCASAADLAGRTPQSIEIKKSEYLGNITDMAEDNNSITSPTYGMYLKTAYEGKDFRVKNLSCSGDRLSFEYAGGMPGDYVMIQAYEKDNFAPAGDVAVRGYVAAMLIGDGRGEMSVNMSESLKRNTANYTFKIWMENPSRVGLAQATRPQTFSFENGNFVEAEEAEDIDALPKNLRMFAMKDELTCSWGDLRKLTNNNVVAGETNSGHYIDSVSGLVDEWLDGKSCGVFASNQIIYFGVESYSKAGGGVVISKPLRFWIAGHDHDEDKLTLYQMSSDETHVFRGSTNTSAGLALPEGLDPDDNELNPDHQENKSFRITCTVPQGQTYKLVSTNPHVAAVDQIGNVTIKGYGEFSIVLFSGDQILQTQTISVDNPALLEYEYIRADEWRDDETEEDEEQPEQPEEAMQDAADGLPQTGDSSAALLWAALLALSLAGLMARRRRSA